MEAVNLLPAEYRLKKPSRVSAADSLDGRRTVRIAGAVALAFAVLLGALYFHERSAVSSKQARLADAQTRIAALQQRVDVIKNAQAEAASRLSTVKQITATSMNWDRALTDFARLLPTNSYLTALQITAPTPAPPVAGGTTTAATTTVTPTTPATPTLQLTGVAPTTPGVALVMDRLSLAPWLSNVSLTSAARQADGSSTFNLTATVAQER
jgi:Tfp pilus assembly protein PilN